MPATVRAEVRIAGWVQGVGFRYYAAQRARSLGIAGWIRNERDGTVAAAFEGPRDRVESMVEWCRRGPGHARVDAIDVVWGDPEGALGFMVG